MVALRSRMNLLKAVQSRLFCQKNIDGVRQLILTHRHMTYCEVEAHLNISSTRKNIQQSKKNLLALDTAKLNNHIVH